MPNDSSAATGGFLHQALLSALSEGADLTPILDFVTQSALTPEQKTVVDVLRKLGDGKDDDGEAVDADTGAEQRVGSKDGLPSDRSKATHADPSDMGELADLREVNDTLAAALGACHICWGGDPSCAVCAGQGRPGFNRPNARLFTALVVPAVRRVYDERRIETPMASGPTRFRRSPSGRVEHG